MEVYYKKFGENPGQLPHVIRNFTLIIYSILYINRKMGKINLKSNKFPTGKLIVTIQDFFPGRNNVKKMMGILPRIERSFSFS